MDEEEHSDIKSILAKFQNHSRSTTLPANYFRNVQEIPAPTISSVRSNPAFLGVISALEGKPQPILPPTFKKPELPAKPSGDSPAVKPLFSSKDYSENHSVVLLKRNSNGNPTVLRKEFCTFKPPLPPKDKVSSAADPMKLSKGLKKTLRINITDSSRSDGDGVCTRSPQVYRQSYPTFVEPNPFQAVDKNQSEGQDCYETVSDGPQTSEKPSVPYVANPKSQMSSSSKKRPPSFSMTNNSEVQDCYETVNDAPPPFIPPRKSPIPSFSPKTFFKEVEANQSEGSDYYEAVDHILQTRKNPLAHGKYQKVSFSRTNPSPIPETGYAKDQACYETVNEASQNLEKSLRPLIPPRKSPVPSFSQVLEPNKSEGQDSYEDVLQAKEKPPVSFSASKKFQGPLFSPKKYPTAMELNQFSHHDCYEAPEDIPKTRAEPSPTFTALSKFQTLSVSGPLLPADPEVNESDYRGCYEDVDSTFPLQVEPPLTFRDYPSFEALPFAERSQCDGQESYEDVESAIEAKVELLPPVVGRTSSPHSSAYKINNKSFRAVEGDSPPSSPHHPVIEDLSPKPTEEVIKSKSNVLPWKSPRIKLLPSIELLGPPPPKDSRPPHVDLMPYLPFTPQVTEVKDDQEEMPKTGNDTEYELPPPSLAYEEEEEEESLYADARQLNREEDGQSNEYEVEESESPEANQLAEIFPSPDERRAHAEDFLEPERSAGDLADYEVQEVGLALGPESARECFYEVSEVSGDAGLSPSVGDLETHQGGSLQRKEDASKNAHLAKPEPASGKTFKILGQEAALYTTAIIKDVKPEKHTLPLKRGDAVDVMRITDCPPGKWLVKDRQDNYGFVPVSCVDMNKSILTFSSRALSLGPGAPDSSYQPERRTYNSGPGTDLPPTADSYSVQSDDTYDDVGNRSPAPGSPGGKGKGFGNFFKKDLRPASSLTSSAAAGRSSGEHYSKGASESGARDKESSSWRLRFLKTKEQKLKEENRRHYGKGISQVSSKKLAKEEKIFREKFKYTGDINVFSVATVMDLAPLTIKNKLDLLVKPGEAVEVIDVTSEDQLICRNSEGKFGYVRIEHLNFHNSY